MDITLSQVFINFILGILLFFLFQDFGKRSIFTFNYSSYTDFYHPEYDRVENAVFRIFRIPAIIIIISSVLHLLSLDYIYSNIWISGLFYYLMQFIIISIILGRFNSCDLLCLFIWDQK